MRVLHIINNLGTGGAEKLLVDSLPILSDRLDVVDLLLLNGTDTPFLTDIKSKFRGQVFFLSTSGSLYNPRFLFKIHTYMSKYDICHVHLFPSLYYVSLCKFFYRLNTPLIFTEHSTKNRRLSNSILRKIDRFIYAQFNIVICITQQVKDVLTSKLGISEEKCHVVNNGIKLDNFANSVGYSKSLLEFAEDDLILLQVSRFSEHKDQKTVIESLTYLPSKIKLLLVGDGPYITECKQHSVNLGVNDRVKFLGTRMDIPEILKTADIVIQSSNWEGFGIAAVEGMASRRPVIASDVPGLREVVKGAGLLFKVGSAEELAEQINMLLNNPNTYSQTAERCFTRALSFSIDKQIDSVIKVYRSLLKHNDDK